MPLVGALCFPSIAEAQWFQVRNSSGSGTPGAPASIYLGDNSLTFTCDAWGTLGGQWGGSMVYIKTSSDIHNGTAGGGINYASTDAKSNTSAQFTSTGTWYWGMRIQYNTSGTIVGWYCRNRSFWSDAWGTPVSELTVTVNALNTPSGQSATRNATNPHTAIDLAWTKGTSGTAKDTLIVRSTSSNFTAPTQGSSYSTGNTIGSGTVIYKGSATSLADSGLSSDTLYYYAFYAENNSYYSAAVTTSVRTRPVDATWDGGGADDNWQTEANWATDLYPFAGSSTILRFAGSTRLTPQNNYTAGTTFGQIWFNSGAGAFKLGGNALVINSKIENSGSTGQVISNALTAAASTLEINPVSGSLTLAGALNNNGQAVQVWGSGGNSLTITNIFSGSGALSIKQHCFVNLSANNTFSGAIWVEKGVLQLQGHTNAAGTGASISVGTNASVELASAITFRPIPLVLYGTGTNDAKGALHVINGGGWNGAITAAANAKIRADGATFNTRGDIDALANTLYITNSAIFDMTAGTLIGTKTSADGALRKSGSERFLLRPGTGLSGSLYIDQGELRQGTGTMPGGGQIFLADGVTWAWDSAGRTITKPVVLNGNVTLGRAAGGSLTITNGVSLSGGTRTITTIATNTISGVISNGALTKAGSTSAGVLVLSGANTYTGATAISAGTLQAGANNVIPDASAVSVSGGATYDLNNNSDTIGSIAGAGAVALGSGTLTAGGDNSSTTFSGVMSGTGALNKDGTGALTMSGENTYSGSTAVRGGTLIYNGTNTSSAIGVGSSSFLYGVGSVDSVTVTGQVSAGTASNAVGALRVSALTLPNNGRMQVNFSAMTGAAGTDWDVVTVGGGAGTVTIDSGAGNEFVIALKGSPTFDNSQGYTNVILEAGALSTFASNKFSVITSEFTPPLGGGSFSVAEIGGDLVLIFAPSAVPVLCSTPASLAFAARRTQNPSPASQTFVVTNCGASGTLDYTNTVTYGAGASGWLSLLPVSGTLAAGGAQITTATVSSASLGVGTYYATNTIYAGAAGTSTVVIALSVTNAPTIAFAPSTLAYHTMLGSSSVSQQTWAVTNIGDGTLFVTNAVTYGTGASGWFVPAPATGAIAAAASQIFTGNISLASISAAGTYVATNAITSSNATNGPTNLIVTLVVSNIPSPTAVTAANDGQELVRLTAAEAAGRQILVVHSYTNALTVSPTNGSPYAVGDLLGNGRVIFKFTGSGSASNLEQVVAAGSTNFYAFFAIYNDYYSPVVAAGATTTTYRANEIVDSFGYTNGVGIQTLSGGHGWTNAWTVSVPRTNTDAVVSGSDFGTFLDRWPAETGNRLLLATTNSFTYSAFRSFPAVTAGKIYVAALYYRQFNEGATDGKFSGISFFDGAAERAFVGERGGSGNDDIFGSSVSGGGNSVYGAANSFTATVEYVLIGRYDFDTGLMSGIYYPTNAAIPELEPTYFITATGAISRIDGIRLASGADVGWNGEVYFDELRIATNWYDLLLRDRNQPYATNYVINGGANVTDAQVTSGAYSVVFHLRSQSGVESTNTTPPFFLPNYDVWTPGGIQILTDRVFSSFSYLDSGLTLVASNGTHASAVPGDIVLGVYTARWSAIASNGNVAIDVTTLSNGTSQAFTVIDDDSTTPAPVGITSTNAGGGSSRLLHISLGAANLSGNGAASNNIEYTVDDASLTNMAAGNPLIFWLGARDNSGLNRDTSNATTNSHLSIGSAIVSNVSNYDASRSDPFAATANARATNIWTWTSPFSSAQVENLVTNSTAVGSNAVVATWRDADADRPNDYTTFVYTQGWLRVTDDDTAGPFATNFVIRGAEGAYTVRVDELTYGTGWSITGRVSDSGSGINVNGTNALPVNNSPYFELWDPNGNLKLREAFDTLSFADGGATTLSSVGDTNNTAFGSAVTGTWTARVVMADNDEDWGNNDHTVSTSEFPFVVIPGAFLGGIGRGPASLVVTSYYGVVSGGAPWPNFYVTNIGSGTLSYSNTITYGSVGGWLSVSPIATNLVGNGVSQIHTASVDAATLNPGSYTATITINGDQTNAAQTINITLQVFGFYVGEIVDQFTNSAGTLNNATGGSGWTNAWNNEPDAGFSVSNSNLTVPNNYPSAVGNKVCGDTSSDVELQSFRYFNSFSTGTIYMAVAIQKSDGNADGFNGISFMSNDTEVAFAGKLFGSVNFGLSFAPGNGGSDAGTFGVNGPGAPGYFYIGKYDFENDRFYGRAYNNSDTLPLMEPTWGVTGTPTVAIGSINGIRIAARNEGTFCFDEIRVSPTWEGLLNLFTNEPSVHSGGMNFRNVTTNSMTVGWTPGNGANRIVVAREGLAVTLSPTDAVSYAFNSDFGLASDLGGGNKVVYNGSGTNFSFTGLNSATQYFFAVFEYNGAGTSANYYTNAGFLTGSRWTLSLEPATQVTAFAAYQVTETQISNTWTAAGGSPAPNGYLILRQANSAPTNLPVDGVGYTNGQVLGTSVVASVVTPDSAITYLHTNLNNCTPYYFVIYSFRRVSGVDETYNYLLPSALTSTASTVCGEPTIQASNITFTAVGTTNITVTWQNGSGSDRLLLVHATNAVDVMPTDFNTYTGSSVFGGGTHLGGGNYAVYVGTNSSVSVIGLLSNVTYHFRVFEYYGVSGAENYNTNAAVGNPNSISTLSFDLAYDSFTRTNTATGEITDEGRQVGGSGWSNSWHQSYSVDVMHNANFGQFKCYPRDTLNGQVRMSDDAFKHEAWRHFARRTSGKLYASFLLNYSIGGANRYAGMSLMDGATELVFFGKPYSVSSNTVGITYNSTDYPSAFVMNAGSGNDYLVVAMYDFESKVMKVKAYLASTIATTDPDEDDSWHSVVTNVNLSAVDGIRLLKRDSGIVYFDEVRVGATWQQVMICNAGAYNPGPTPTLVYIGTNYTGANVGGPIVTNLSDAELASSTLIDFAVRWDDANGVFVTNSVASGVSNIYSGNGRVIPNWDPLAIGSITNSFGLDRIFYATNIFGANGSLSVTTYVRNAFNVTNISFENQYFVTVSAEDYWNSGCSVSASVGEDVYCNRGRTINFPLGFAVYDDDTNAPAYGDRPLRVLTNATLASSQSAGGLMERYFIYDGVLTQSGMRVQLGVYDSYSGLERLSGGSVESNLSLTIPFVATNDTANYNASLSSTNTKTSSATSTWVFASSLFTWDRVSAMWGGDGTDLQGDDIEVRANAPDADEDRVEDQAWASNQVMGYLRLLDDDILPPQASPITFAGSASRPFFVNTNGFAIGSGDTEIRNTYSRRSGTGSNTVFAITDEELAQSGSRSLQFAFGALDADTGVRRGASGTTNTIMSFGVGDGILSGVATGWSAGLSTAANSPNVVQTNVWAFGNGFFTESVITQLLAVTGSSGSGSNRIAVTIPDSDDDRTNDQSTAYSQTVGWLQVFDDDVSGPLVASADVPQSPGGDTLLATSFETNQFWPVSPLSSSTPWTNTDSYGSWVGVGVTHTSLDPKNTGTRRLGMLTNTFTQPYIQIPPVDNPGRVSIYAARVSGGSGTPLLRLESRDAASWINQGELGVTNTVYERLTWDIDLNTAGVTLRLVRVNNGENRTQVYLDDITINGAAQWISTNSVTMNWSAGVDDYSSVGNYRVVAPAMSTVTPSATNDGMFYSSGVTSAVVDITGQQGILTGHVFAVDNDNDRANDAAMGNVVSVLVRVDTNPPLVLLSVTNDITDPVVDETSELKITWTPNGTNTAQAAGRRESDHEPLSPWDSYVVYVHELDGSFNEISTNVITSTNGPVNLGTNTTSSIVISNLNFDAYHRIRIAGRDRAGNLGPFVTVTGLTVNFQVTQGWARTTATYSNAIRLAWIAASNRVYDELYVDAASMSDSMSDKWDWLDRVTNDVAGGNTLFDAGGNNPTNRYRVSPSELGSTMRFYRVSQKDLWQASNAVRRGSREVYVAKPLRLMAGENWYSIFFAPDTSTVAYVFGTNRLPAGGDYSTATKIHWFSPTNIGASYNYSTNTIGFVGSGYNGTWLRWTGDWGAIANDMIFPVHQGFMLEMPPGSPTINLPIVGRVITQELVRTIVGRTTSNEEYHIMSWNYPFRVSLTGLLLRGSGMTGSAVTVLADEIRVLRNAGNGSLEQPKARWRLGSDQSTWFRISYNTNIYTTPPDVSTFRIEPDDAIIFVRRGTNTIYWTNRVYYTAPGKNFDP